MDSSSEQALLGSMPVFLHMARLYAFNDDADHGLLLLSFELKHTSTCLSPSANRSMVPKHAHTSGSTASDRDGQLDGEALCNVRH